MSDARTAILGQIRHALGRDALDAASAVRLDARRPAHTRIAIADDLVQRFIAKFESRSGSVARIADLSALPAAVEAYRIEHEIPARAAVAQPLAGLDWSFPHHPGPCGKDEVLSVTPCLAGIAEMGSVMLASGPDSPTTLNFVPDYHVVVLHVWQIVRHYEDAWALLRSRQTMPRTVNIISGPSRTGDVELIIQLGAHGPRRVHVILVD